MATKRNRTPQPEPKAVTGDELPANEVRDNVVLLDLLVPKTGKVSNIFTMSAKDENEKITKKMALLGSIRQKLAEAADLFKAGDEEANKANELADTTAGQLYQARADGTISATELSGLLGDIFGYKPKTDGTPGKTPAGQGEVLRKRIVRAVSAFEYVTAGDGGRFFVNLPEDEVQAVVNDLDGKALSVWGAYDRLARLKQDNTTRLNLAFDPRRIAAIAEALSEKGAKDVVHNSPELVEAYAFLLKVLAIVGQVEAKAA